MGWTVSYEKLPSILILEKQDMKNIKDHSASDPIPANIYLFNINNKRTRNKRELCSKLKWKYQNDVIDSFLF